MGILVTGGNRFLGAAVARALCDLGQKLILLVPVGDDQVQEPAGPASGPIPKNIQVIHGDVTNLDDVAGAMVGCHWVVHLSTHGFKNVVRAASFGAIDRILYTSTIAALGPTDGLVGNEDSRSSVTVPTTPFFLDQVDALRFATEQIEQGAPITLLHQGFLYGPGMTAASGWVTGLLADLAVGRCPIIGPGDRRHCVAFTDDVARGHRLALESGRSGRSYILGGHNITLHEWCERAGRVTGAIAPRRHVSYGISKLYGTVSAMTARITGRPALVTPELVEFVKHEWAYSSHRAEEELGYTVTDLDAGLSQSFAAAPSLRAKAAS